MAPGTFIRPTTNVPEHLDKWAVALGKDTVYDSAAEWVHTFDTLNTEQRGLWHQAADDHARQKGFPVAQDCFHWAVELEAHLQRDLPDSIFQSWCGRPCRQRLRPISPRTDASSAASGRSQMMQKWLPSVKRPPPSYW